jgi:hypothetical protein
MTLGGTHGPMKLLSLGFLLSIALVVTTQTLATGGSSMGLTADEKTQIRKAVEVIDNEEPALVFKGDEAALTRVWADDFTVSASTNRVLRKPEILERMKQHSGLQYSSFERHREAIVVRRDYVVTTG